MVREDRRGEDRGADARRDGGGDEIAAPVAGPVLHHPAGQNEDARRAGHGELEARAAHHAGAEQRDHQRREAERTERARGCVAEASQHEGGGHPGGAGGGRGGADEEDVAPHARRDEGGAAPRRLAGGGEERAEKRGDHPDVEAGDREEVGGSGPREGVPELARDSLPFGQHERRGRASLAAEPALERVGGPSADGRADARGPGHRGGVLPLPHPDHRRRAQVRRFASVGPHRTNPPPLDDDRAGLRGRAFAGVDADFAAVAPQRGRPLGARADEVAGDAGPLPVGHPGGAARLGAAAGGPPEEAGQEARHEGDGPRSGTAPCENGKEADQKGEEGPVEPQRRACGRSGDEARGDPQDRGRPPHSSSFPPFPPSFR